MRVTLLVLLGNLQVNAKCPTIALVHNEVLSIVVSVLDTLEVGWVGGSSNEVDWAAILIIHESLSPRGTLQHQWVDWAGHCTMDISVPLYVTPSSTSAPYLNQEIQFLFCFENWNKPEVIMWSQNWLNAVYSKSGLQSKKEQKTEKQINQNKQTKTTKHRNNSWHVRKEYTYSLPVRSVQFFASLGHVRRSIVLGHT